MVWRKSRNIENSLKDFLDTQIATDVLVGENGNAVIARIGKKVDSDWTYPCITVYQESEDLTKRLYIGSNKRDEYNLIIIEIYATNDGERKDLANWLTDTINDGCNYSTYAVDPNDPETPVATIAGWINVNFLTNTKVKLGNNVSAIDANRQRVSINVWI